MSVVNKLCFLLLFHHWHTTITFAQLQGQFPQPSSVSLDRPVFATSTCGSGEDADAYCQYSSNAELSLSPNCMNAVCNSTCSFSSSSPVPTNVASLNATFGSGVVTSSDSSSGPGTTDILEFTNSFISSLLTPKITSDGFTFAVWIKQDSDNNGALLSKASGNGANRRYAISATETSVVFDYLPNTANSGYSTLTFNNLDLSSSFWHHVAVTVYDNDFALYINGSIESADGLSAPIDDSVSSTVYLGQIAPNLNQYNGLMQDIFAYPQALTAREIEELFTGELPYIFLQNECRCPPSHPLINSNSPSSCIQHTGTTTARGSAARLNSLAHPVGFINDKSFFTAWISEIDLQQSNVTMDLISGSSSAYELIFINIRYSSPPPKAAILEKTIDGGETYSPMQYFASDCISYFGMQNDGSLQGNDDVNCITQYSSQTPTTGVTARVRYTDGSRGILDSSNEALQNFILSDGLRIRFIDYFTKNTTSEHRYYSVADFSVAARCACNGHAPRCTSDATAVCDCVHNTQGDRCEECLPLYNDKPWRKGTNSQAFPCKQCSCNNHASACHYNSTIDPSPDSYDLGGGGICDDCQDNTDGDNCETCVFGYYRKAGVDPSDSEPCTPCGCDSAGSTGEDCVKHEGIPGQIVGQCDCKVNVEGLTCSECKTGFFGLSASNSDGCQPCNCNTDGTVSGSETCNTNTGQCVCKVNVEGLKCDQCVNGTSGLHQDNPDGCSSCVCNELGSIDDICDINGDCKCKPGVMGSSCDQCEDGYYGLSENGCQQCQCSVTGSINSTCDTDDGACYCKTGFTGLTCEECSMGYFLNTSSLECVSCQCDEVGTVADQINNCNMTTGQCQCKANVTGRDCDSCTANHTNLQDSGCTPCDCVLGNTDSTADTLCDPVSQQCSCLPLASGLRCESCNDGYFANSDGTCMECGCDTMGSNGIGCTADQQCDCLNENITGLTCSECITGHYDFPNCLQCLCNASGSISSVCDSDSGVCQCKEFVTGMNCDTCVEGYKVLQASNPFGCTAAPEEQAPPTPQTVFARSIIITWVPPEKPNGMIALYSIRRNGVLIDSVPGSILVFNDTGLVPNTSYQYIVESENIAGSALSDPVSISTLEGAPEGINPPTLTVINSTSINAVWTPPNITNGIVINYNLILVSMDGVLLDSPVTQFSGLALSYVVTGLKPFSVHTFRLEACTSQECGSSPEVNATTSESVPEYQPPPTLSAVNSTTISISWTEPPSPNGIIIKYEVYQRSSPFTGDGVLIESVSSDVLSIIADGLQPFTEYEFSVFSFTNVGGKQSNWTRENTQEIAPEDLIAPSVIPISSTELSVQWFEPTTPNGVITQYQVFILYPTDNSTDSVGNFTSTGSHVVGDLTPYTQYGVYVVVCNVAGCTTTGTVYAVTLEGIPSGLGPPRLSNITGSAISLDWDPPSSPNGVITSYSITRQVLSLEPSPSQRDIGTAFYGADYASYPPSNELRGINTEISLMFKTLQPDGVLMYTTNNANTDLIAIELRNGLPWFVYDSGSGPAAITIDAQGTRFDNGLWHTLKASRTGVAGTLTIDDTYTGTGASIGFNTFIGQSDVLYIGGLRHATPLITSGWGAIPNATLDGLNFAGCLFDVEFNSVSLDLGTILNSNPGVGSPGNGCPLYRERGVSFLGGGFISLPYTSPETDSFSFSIQFRTTRSSSLMFFAHSGDVSNYIAVMLQDSDLIVRIKSSDNEISLSSASLFLPDELCSGNWYSLYISKESNGITVEIGNQTLFSPLQNSFNVSTMSNLYIGGTPVSSDAWDAHHTLFSTYPVSFSGCVKNFMLNGVAMDLHRNFGDSLEHVRFDGCDSTYDVGLQTCTQGMTQFGLGSERKLTDNANLSPFTEYLYRVSAMNSAGEVSSSWSLGMTGEDKPNDAGVVNVTTRSSSSLEVTWSLEGTTNGLVTRYEVKASPLNTTGLESPIGPNRSYLLSVESPTQDLSLELTDLEPATTYSCVLRAFNSIGFGAGPAVLAVTLEDVPVGVATPTGLLIGSDEVTVQWDSPTKPNGVIILYRVYIDGSTVETTNSVATVQSLEPFSTYTYHLEACTVVGCTNGTDTTISTNEGTPKGLAPPTLIALSSQTVQINWASPTNPNGVITHYEVLSVFGGDLSQTESIANSTQLTFIVSGLSPNTLYHFKVVVYNSVGSVASNVSSIRTLEDTPEMISPPNVTVISSSSLLVTWEEPLQPNGAITNYTVYRNLVSVFFEKAGNLSYMFTDTGLDPFTVYSYFIIVCNSKGCGASTMSMERTAEAVPGGLQMPAIVSVSSDSAVISFGPATMPNGEVTYILRVMGEFLVSHDSDNLRQTIVEMRVVYNHTETHQMVIVGDLIPYTSYNVQVEASNSAGSTFGDDVSFTTLQAAPELLSPPETDLVTSTSLRVSWTPPTYPNGEITSYEVFTVSPSMVVQSYSVDGNSTSTIIHDLDPYTNYTVYITASNIAGNVTSDFSSIITGETSPSDFDQPSVSSITPYSMVVSWDPPASPNGVIINYTISITSDDIDYTSTMTVPANHNEFNMTGLQPFTEYNITVEGCNSVGCVRTPVIADSTNEAAPQVMASPDLSTLPNAVIITWTEPEEENGVILTYIIHKSIVGGEFTILETIQVVDDGQDLVYTDTDVKPFTVYRYKVEASNSAGSVVSNYSSVLTQEDAPEGVRQPILKALSSSSVQISIQPPLTPNGIITRYTINRLMNGGHLAVYTHELDSNDMDANISYIDTGLSPYTVYYYTITAFTTAGNTTSNVSSVRTLEAPPTGLQSPSALLSGDTSILIGWGSPLEENGVILSYTILRVSYFGDHLIAEGTIVEYLQLVCLEYAGEIDSSGESYYELSMSVSIEVGGDTTSYIDKDLDPYTYYGYCVVASNGAGSVASGPSNVVLTLPALQPTAGPNVTASTTNSTAIAVTWAGPGPEELLGPLTSYTLYMKESSAGDGLGNEVVSGLVYSHVITGLTPSTTYTFTVAVNNSRGIALSTPTNAETSDGIPSGVIDPVATTTSSASILVSWVEPLIPNGDITRYSILLNGELYLNQSIPGSASVTGLKPFTVYVFRLEVCTELGCVLSGQVTNKTFEAAPTGLASPFVTVLGPNSASVSWMSPAKPNGIVTAYSLYVREKVLDCSNTSCYVKTLQFSGYAFNYTVTGLSPYTQYAFEVVAQNGGGNVSSGFTTVTTDEDVPTLVLPPDADTLSAYSIRIEWEEPLEPNGVIVHYIIYRSGSTVIYSGNDLSSTDTGLMPFSMYSYTVEACTSAGCTNSTEAVNKTYEAPPEGFASPVITDIQAYSVVISWAKPSALNGENENYAVSFANGTSIASGLIFSVTVEGLSPFTSYSFFVTVSNTEFSSNSSSVSVVTLEAPPTGLSPPSINFLSSTEVELTWKPPTSSNGIIVAYILRRDGMVIYNDTELSYVDGNLLGDTPYNFTVEAINSAGSVISDPVFIQTSPGLPGGVGTPTATILSSTSIYVEWSEPEFHNGDISSYNLSVNDLEVVSGLLFSHTLTGLTPYTNYTLRIQVCNQAGCASSKSVTVTTLEGLPLGLSAPAATEVTSTTVTLSWAPPTTPNGLITSYRVVRRETNNPLLILVQYVGVGDVTTFTNEGLSPYTSYEYQLVAFNSIGSVESSWREVTTLETPPTGMAQPTFPDIQSTYVVVSWTAPSSSNGVLTRYDVSYRPLLGDTILHQSLPTNVTQANITGLEPFTIYEFQIEVYNSVGKASSGFTDAQTLEGAPEGIGNIILVTKTSESVTVMWAEPLKPNGIISEYVLYLNGVEEYRDTPRMAFIDRLKPFTSYSILLEACTSVACAQGEIQGFTTEESNPIGQPSPELTLIGQRAVSIEWGFPIQSNGLINSYEIFRSEVPEPLINNNMTVDAMIIYTTDDVSNRVYNDTGLTPDTGYVYAVRANNSIGSSLSSYEYIQTPQAAPEQVQGPTLNVIGTSSIKMTWDPPIQKNGELTQYQIYRATTTNSDIKVYTGLNREFTDTGLKPYTQYLYTVEACTIAGCANSSSTSDTTDQSIPESIAHPELTALSSSSISVKWTEPDTPNGVLVLYRVNIISPIVFNSTHGPSVFETTISSLEPFTVYSVTVEACTMVGCVVSNQSSVMTLEAVPMLQGAPSVHALSPSSVSVSWEAPSKPNGIITNYILRRNNTIVHSNNTLSFIDSGLLPNQEYTYDVQSFTSVGGGDRSSTSIVTTHADTPEGVGPPKLTPLDSTSILAEWAVPDIPNGVIQKYILYVNESVRYEGMALGVVITDLGIFTMYSFRVEACTTTCGSSLHSYATTMEGTPMGLDPPTLSLSSNESVLVSWLPPISPNGIITSYSIDRAMISDGDLGTVTQIISDIPATNLQYVDDDSTLAPATMYSYRLTASNSAGSVSSGFTSITLPDGAPQNLSAPTLVSKTDTSFTVSVSPPQVSNGVLTKYTLFGDNLFPIVTTPTTQVDPVSFTHSGLEPYTVYRVYAEVCTVGGCVLGLATEIQTNESTPTGLLSPFVTVQSPRRLLVEWSPPTNPNGVITGYKLYYKLPCPQPVVIPSSATTVCTQTEYSLVTSNEPSNTQHSFDSTSTPSNHPYPYTSYQFVLEAENSAGAVNSSETDVVTTDDSVPEQINEVLFSVYTSNQSIALNWGSTFRINGQLKSYTVIRDGIFLFIGTQTYAVFPNQPVNTVLQFSVRVSNGNYQFTTPSIPLQITIDEVMPSVTMTTPTPTNTTEAPTTSQFYSEPAFVVGMVILAVIVCFVLILVGLCLIRPDRSRTSDKYDTLRSEKGGTPNRGDGTTVSGWTHEPITPVPSYNDALHNYASGGAMPKSQSSYSPVKAELMSQLNDSYSPQSKIDLASYKQLQTDEIPLVDTHIARLSVIEEIPLQMLSNDNNKEEIELELEPASTHEESFGGGGEDDEVTLKKNMELTGSQEFILDTAI